MKEFFTNISLTRRVHNYAETGSVWTDQPTVCRVDLAVDLDALFRELGTKALHNKSKRSHAMAGAITATVKVL